MNLADNCARVFVVVTFLTFGEACLKYLESQRNWERVVRKKKRSINYHPKRNSIYVSIQTRLLRRTSSGRRLNIKCVIFFPVIVCETIFLLIDSYQYLYLFLLLGCCITGMVKIDSDDKPMRFIGMKT